MNVSKEIKNQQLILRLSGDIIGENNGMQILSAANEALDQNISQCIIDIQNLRYINSTGIGLFITLLTKFRNKGGEAYLMNPPDAVQKLLTITKLNAVFRIIKNENEVSG